MGTPLMSLCWKEHSCQLAAECKNLLAEGFLVDCTIAAEGQKLKAHRLILSTCSPFFQMLFREESEKHPIVILKDALFDTLKAVIDFVYVGEIQIPADQLQAFLALAESLQIKGLNKSRPKDRNKILCPYVAGSVPHCLPKDNGSTCGLHDSSTVGEESSEISSQQQHPHLYSSGRQRDAVQTWSFASCEGYTKSCQEVVSASVVMPLCEWQTIPVCNVHFLDAEVTVKHEPLHSCLLATRTESSDNPENSEHVSENLGRDLTEVTSPVFGDHGLNESSSASEPLAAGPVTRPRCKRGPPKTQLCPTEQPHRSSARTGTSRSSLAQRKKTHAGQGPFRCEVCNTSFTRSSDLKRHQRTHIGERPFRCDVCGSSFAHSCYLKIHQRTHTGERPFRCVVCSSSFARAGDLKRLNSRILASDRSAARSAAPASRGPILSKFIYVRTLASDLSGATTVAPASRFPAN